MPGEPRVLPLHIKAPRVAVLRLEVVVRPDRFYEGFDEAALAGRPQEAAVAGFREALSRARSSQLTAWRGQFTL